MNLFAEICKAVVFAALLAVLLAGAARAQEDIKQETKDDGSLVMTLTPEQAVFCLQNGGCVVIPMNVIRDGVKQIIQQECGKKEI